MWSFKAYYKKELLEAVRQYKFIMLAAGIIIFAILDPIMLKLLPTILKSQLPADISALFVVTQKSAIQNYIKDLNQVGLLFVIFIFSGTLCDEIYNQKLVFPYSKGARPISVVLAKFINYVVFVTIFCIIGFLINFYYISIFFTKDPLTLIDLIPSITLVCVFYIFNIALTIFLSSVFKKGLFAGITALSVNIITGSLTSIKAISKFIPSKLISLANNFNFKDSEFTIIFTLILTLLFVFLSFIRMNNVEVI
jgi:ABC-2 type transport system permease protein